MVFPRPKIHGFTLAETMVGLGVAGIIMAGVCAFLFLFSRSSSTIIGYSVINSDDRQSLEIVGRDIREADSFVSFGPTNISLLMSNLTVQLRFAKNERRLYKTVAGTNWIPGKGGGA